MVGTRIEERPLRIEVVRGGDPPKHRRRICCGFTLVIVAIIAIVLVILGVTVFKTKDPRISIGSVTLQNLDFDLGSAETPLRLNLTLSIEMAVKNPNKASFKFRNSTTTVDYRGTTVAEAYLPPGKIPADKTGHLTPVVTVMADRFASNSQLLTDLMDRLLLTTSTRLVGRVNVLNVFKHRAVAYASCNVSISLTQRKIDGFACTRKVKL